MTSNTKETAIFSSRCCRFVEQRLIQVYEMFLGRSSFRTQEFHLFLNHYNLISEGPDVNYNRH